MKNTKKPASGLILMLDALDTRVGAFGMELNDYRPHIVLQIDNFYLLVPTTKTEIKFLNVELNISDGVNHKCWANLPQSFSWSEEELLEYITKKPQKQKGYVTNAKVKELERKYNELMRLNDGGYPSNNYTKYKQNTFWFDEISGKKVKILSNNWNNKMNRILIIADVDENYNPIISTSRRADKSRLKIKLSKLSNNFIV